MKKLLFSITLIAIMLSGCVTTTPIPEGGETANTPEITAEALLPYQDPALSTAERVEDLLARMTLEEKIGQMTQIEKGNITPKEVTALFIGSVLSGGGGSPSKNNPAAWAKMVDEFQEAALATRLGIPMIYGVDAVHGHANVYGATVFPQNIGLGAADDAELMRRIGQATAKELWATGIPWNFGPVVAVPQDIRWGRTYEGLGEETDLVTRLAIPYIEGMQMPTDKTPATGRLFTLATAKHYIGDGGTVWGTSSQVNMNTSYQLDQGDMQMEEAEIHKLFLPPYQAAVDVGVGSVMASFNSWNGVKLHGDEYLLSQVLKSELGFDGFIISDWQAINQISPDYYEAVVTAIHAGIDMNMVPYNAYSFIAEMKNGVENGDIPMERIDDAVRRILTIKFELGLFEQPYSRPELLESVGSTEHREIAREAVRKSLVLLKNENEALPIAKDTSLIFVAGQGADDIGMQCGGWTIEWQGQAGNITPGTTILAGIQEMASADTQVVYDGNGEFDTSTKADVTLVVIGEQPYAEGVGDQNDLSLFAADIELIERARETSDKLIVIILSGRPLVITEQFPLADAWVAAWLPGTEGNGVTDVLFGEYPFTGKLPYTWPRSNEQLPININNLGEVTGCEAPLFPFGYGLGEAGSELIEWVECP